MVGNGNVAVDVARMLSLTHDELHPTDTTHAAIDAIVGSGLKEIVMLGRRGPVQAAFTNPELKELGELAGADVIVDPADLVLDPASEAALAEDRSAARRNVDLLREYAARAPEGKPRRLVLRFLVSPVAILGDGKVEAVEVVRNTLVADERGQLRAVATGEREMIPCGLVLRSVGYRGVALPGVPFDESRGMIPNADGRILDADGAPVPGPLLRRLDQARPERRHRHEQEGRRRDRRPPARGCRSRPAPARRGRPRGAPDGARAAVRRVRRLGGDRRARARPRRPARPPAREARHLGRAARAAPTRR